MANLILASDHSTLLHHWRHEGKRQRKLLHLDGHCDLRGAVFDAQGQLTSTIKKVTSLDQGNFLLHAGLEGLVSSIRWVHDDLGGREMDIGTVLFEEDLNRSYRNFLKPLRRPVENASLHFEIIHYDHWKGFDPDEELDLDWDFFAAPGRTPEQLDQLTESFLNTYKNSLPQIIYLVASPEFSTPWSEDRYWKFSQKLSHHLGVEPLVLEDPWPEQAATPLPWRLVRKVGRTVLLGIKQRF